MKTTHIFSRFLSAFAVFIVVTPLHAQWIKTSGPDSVRALLMGNIQNASGGTTPVVYAGTRNGVFLSLNSGASWTGASTGLTHRAVQALALTNPIRPGIVFAGTQGGGVFRSTNNGASWIAINNGLTALDIRALVMHGTTLFAGTPNGVFGSADSGANWIAVNNGLPTRNIRTLESSVNLFAGTDSGIFQTANSGSSWSSFNNGLLNLDVRSIKRITTGLSCVGTGTGIYYWALFSSNPSWKAATIVLPNLVIHSLAGAWGIPDATGDMFLAGTAGGGALLSLGGSGQTWKAINDGLTEFDVRAVAMDYSNNYYPGSTGYIFAGTNGGVWRRQGWEVNPSSVRPANGFLRRFRIDGDRSVSFHVPTLSFVSLKVLDISGRAVSVLFAEELPAGTHTRQLNTTTLPNGLYFYRFQSGTFTSTRKVLLSR